MITFHFPQDFNEIYNYINKYLLIQKYFSHYKNEQNSLNVLHKFKKICLILILIIKLKSIFLYILDHKQKSIKIFLFFNDIHKNPFFQLSKYYEQYNLSYKYHIYL